MDVGEKAGDSILEGEKGMGEGKNKVEAAVKKWLAERGYDYEVRTYMPDGAGEGTVKREKDIISVPAGVEDVESFMEQFAESFAQINGITELKNSCKCQENGKNILVVEGGGRPNGNTSQLAECFAKGAGEAGHKVEIVSLQKNEVKGCLGCNACRYGKPCVQKDSFNSIVPKIENADMIVFASPLYFWTISSKLKAFIERFYCLAQKDDNPPLGRYEKYPEKDCALLMTAADDFFWTFEQAVSYYRFAIVNYIGFHDRGMLLAGGCGDTNGKPQIDKTGHLAEAYEFGKNIYR